MSKLQLLAWMAQNAPAIESAVEEFASAVTPKQKADAIKKLIDIAVTVFPTPPAASPNDQVFVTALANAESITDIIGIIQLVMPILEAIRQRRQARLGQGK